VVTIIKTYQDLEALSNDEDSRMSFVEEAVDEHKNSEAYRVARVANEYYTKRNTTISKLQKFLYNMAGQKVPDLFSANNKLKTLFYRRFVIQQVQFLLANGVSFENKNTRGRLGAEFDAQISKLATYSMNSGVAFGFWNLDHLEVFDFVDTPAHPGFVPLYDEESGALKAGIRYWRSVSTKTKRYTLYEPDGFTDYIQQEDENIKVQHEKRTYKQRTVSSEATGDMCVIGENYPGFPIIPMYANDLHESEIIGIQECIDCYDYVKSGLANDIDDATGFYWFIKNVGGMDDPELAQFLERLRTVKAAALPAEEGVDAEAHTLDVPYEARTVMLDRLERDLYKDFQIVNTSELSAGNKTATEIRAAYQPMNDKCAAFRDGIKTFIMLLFELIGISDTPSFRVNQITNELEETQKIMMAASEIGTELLLKKLPWLTPEEVESRIKEMSAEELGRFSAAEPGDGDALDDAVDAPTTSDAIDVAEEAVGKALNGIQAQNLSSIIKGFTNGTLTEGQAVNLISTALGVTKDEAREIIRGE